MTIRVGQGFDVHRWTQGRPLMLGGVEIPHPHGLLGHSDADVLLHAICDAILGAAGLGDIGHHFPDDDPTYKGADSAKLLVAVRDAAAERGWKPINIDSTVICQAPKLAPHMPRMRERIAELLQLSRYEVNVKATTTERLGFTGRDEGVAAMAVALLGRDAGQRS